MNKVLRFVSEVVFEMMQIRWPTRRQLYVYTLVVMITVFIAAIILGFMDAAFSNLIKLLIAL